MSPVETQQDAASQPALAASNRANQTGVRLYNERLILSLVRRNLRLTKVEVARLTGLSVQSTSAIMNRLQRDGLLKREAPLRGRVGQPTTPVSLDSEGAFSLGLKIGRRSCDLVLIDFLGALRARASIGFAYPTPAKTFEFVERELPNVLAQLTPTQLGRVAGLGIASPFELWSWASEIGAPASEMDAWRSVDIEAEVARRCAYQVSLCNDATAACAAEFSFGQAWRYRDFLYFFLGSFVGGGLVVDGALFPGRTGNAAAVGSMPMAAGAAGAEPAQQLISRASVFQLEKRVEALRLDPSSIWKTPGNWRDFGLAQQEWLEEAAASLAFASVCAMSVIDIEAVVIDGAIPSALRDQLTKRVAFHMSRLDRRGLSEAVVVAGAIGPDARAIGGAALPLIKNFARDREVLFKDAPNGAN